MPITHSAPPTFGSGAYADGVAPGRLPATYSDTYDLMPHEPAPIGKPHASVAAADRIRAALGARSVSYRTMLILRQVGGLFVLLGCVAVSSWSFSATPSWRYGGMMMLFSIAFMMLCMIAGSVMYSDSRQRIAAECRHFVYGIVAIPGAAIAVLLRLMTTAWTGPEANADQFINLLRSNGLPLAYFATVLLPAVVFAKFVFGGIRAAQHNAMNDSEHMSVLLRHDGMQR
jgi:hypothetical protein